MIRSGECTLCGECCKTVNVTAVRDLALREHGKLEELRRYMKFRGVNVAGEDAERNLLFYEIPISCSQLGTDNTCKVHDSPEKPLICHRYPREPGDIPDCGYRFEPRGIPGIF